MKYFLILLLTCLLSLAAHSQIYSFHQFTAPYVALDSSQSVSVNGDSTWGDDTTFNVPIGFSFKLLTSTYSKMHLLLGNLLFENTYRSFSPLSGIVMEDRGSDAGHTQSPISYQLTGTSPDRILKIQWKNAGFGFDSGKGYANFQTWLYEGSNNIEARYGKSSVPGRLFQTQTGGPQVGIEVQDSMGKDSFVFLLYNSPDSPGVKNLQDNVKGALSGMPAEGTVYQFKYEVISGITEDVSPQIKPVIYPNPVNNVLHISYAEQLYIKIFNTTGEEVYSRISKGDSQLNVSFLKAGVYFIREYNEYGAWVEKVIKEY